MSVGEDSGAPVIEAPIIEIAGLSKHYGPIAAVDKVDLTIRRGEFFALLGPSGCGKTTLLRMLAGLELPTAGTIRIDGQDMSRVPANRRPVNMVFQSYAVFPHMSVLDNVAYGLRVDGIAKAEAHRRAEEALDLVKLGGYGKRRPDQLSGGQRQRVALARALVKRPKVLLLDEPLSALDAKLREQMRFELVNLQESVGITFVVVTHDQDEALSMATRIAVMDNGTVQQTAPPAELYEFPSTKFVADFIGSVNLIEGRVAESAAGLVRMTAPALQVPVEIEQEAGMPVGATGWLALRPEKVDISRDPPEDGGRNTVVGTVEEITYLGDVSIFHVRLTADQPLIKVTIANLDRVTRRPFTWGDRVHLSWAPTCGVVLAQ
ncbi:MAG: ABC transporter ATP-binding protein [Thalassobaculum sp.]|uniref:ABC transporter ATP-binding protein n=1 Tax=Thalassobaculum sp. TaxID=2022740 RepID=UPI0032F05AD0